jgi:hypothetical protein
MTLIYRSSSFQVFLFKVSSLNIFYSFKFLFIASFLVNLGQFLSLLCYQDDLEYYYILIPQKNFVRYDQTIANDVGTSLEFCYPKFILYIIISYLSLLVWPYIKHKTFISVTFIFWMHCPFIAQHSVSYIIADLIAVM